MSTLQIWVSFFVFSFLTICKRFLLGLWWPFDQMVMRQEVGQREKAVTCSKGPQAGTQTWAGRREDRPSASVDGAPAQSAELSAAALKRR